MTDHDDLRLRLRLRLATANELVDSHQREIDRLRHRLTEEHDLHVAARGRLYDDNVSVLARLQQERIERGSEKSALLATTASLRELVRTAVAKQYEAEQKLTEATRNIATLIQVARAS